MQSWVRWYREVRMKRNILAGVLAIAALVGIGFYGHGQQSRPARTGMVIGVKPDRISAYEALHAASNPGVRDLLDKYHMHNFSIYIQKMDDNHYLEFAYYEYTGSDPKADAAALAKEPRNIKWLSQTDAMQIPLPGATGWTKMQEIFHNP
jgi:L-rhamnose mutarotase